MKTPPLTANPGTPTTSRCPYHIVRDFLSSLFHRPVAGSQPSGRCPYAGRKSAAVQEVPTPGEDPEADALLADARAHLYRWPENFAGFKATMTYQDSTTNIQAPVCIRDSSSIEVRMPDAPANQWIREQLHEFVSHREHASKNQMTNHRGVTREGAEDPVLGTKLKFSHDPMESFYRIKDAKITQIGRAYPAARFVVSIFDHHGFDGRFAARTYSVTYWDKSSGAIVKTETFVDEYLPVDGVYLPLQRTHLCCTTSTELRVLSFRDHTRIASS